MRKKVARPDARPEPSGPKAFFGETIVWSGPLFYHRPDRKMVLGVAVSFFVLAGLIQFFQKNIITTIFFVLLGIVILLYSKKKPAKADFGIGPAGVRINGWRIPFKEIKSFWINYTADGTKELSLQLKKWYQPYVKIPIDGQNPVQIRSFLIQFVLEDEHEETLTDIIARRLGL